MLKYCKGGKRMKASQLQKQDWVIFDLENQDMEVDKELLDILAYFAYTTAQSSLNMPVIKNPYLQAYIEELEMPIDSYQDIRHYRGFTFLYSTLSNRLICTTKGQNAVMQSELRKYKNLRDKS
jgi:hypothetical protein